VMIAAINKIKRLYKSHGFSISLGVFALVFYSLPHEGRPILGICIHVASGVLIVLALGIQIKRQDRLNRKK